ncbi:phenoloxidase-activating factor 2-like [Anopheles nili]|uniref:phenoloxidase-activating factor 2-like n=1 Tax=Anopheles nili TaxID=185578 RepID=UPI00237C20ED|nr:phenoloxidase-activating factor 2-like [Anopheles nili]
MATLCLWILGLLCSVIAAENSVVSIDSHEICTTRTNDPGICVYQYQCKDGVLNSFGEHIIDLRQPLDDCNDHLLVCCAEPTEDTTAGNEPFTNVSTGREPWDTEDEENAKPPPRVPSNGQESEKRPTVDIKPYTIEGCGHRNPHGVVFTIENNVFSESEYGEYPWAVAIFKRSNQSTLKYICGGALIDQTAILTTASCLKAYRHNMGSLVVRLGEWDIDTAREPLPHVDSEVEKIHLHPQYGTTSKINDIAIIILRDTVELNHNIGVVCLPPVNTDPRGADVVGVGWGDVPTFVEPTKRPQTILKKTHLRHLAHETCQQTLRRLMGRRYMLSPSFLCAQATDPEMLPCKGDSGSPYVMEAEHGIERYYLVGLSSWGYDCNKQNAPTVLTNVAYHRRWIDGVINDEDLNTLSYTYEGQSGNEEE